MDRRSFVKTAALVPLAAGCAPLSLASPVESKQENAAADRASSAPMRDRYELTLQRVLKGDSPAYTEEFLLADVRPTAGRRFTEFSGDLSGRYIGALATAGQVYGAKFPSLDGLVQKVIACQKPDGYFGRSFDYKKPTDDDLALLWGNGRLLVGLVEYYRVKPSPEVLTACREARRLAGAHWSTDVVKGDQGRFWGSAFCFKLYLLDAADRRAGGPLRDH